MKQKVVKENRNVVGGKGNLYVSNAFSLQMIGDGVVEVDTLSRETFDLMKEFAYSVMGHPDMAEIHGVPFNRESIKLETGDQLLVAQITGGRLPEGATVIPEDVVIEYKLVTIY